VTARRVLIACEFSGTGSAAGGAVTYVELFAGVGGLSRGLEQTGWQCAAHAEKAPHAQAVLRTHWPDTPLYGDVRDVDWRAHQGVSLVSGGAPAAPVLNSDWQNAGPPPTMETSDV